MLAKFKCDCGKNNTDICPCVGAKIKEEMLRQASYANFERRINWLQNLKRAWKRFKWANQQRDLECDAFNGFGPPKIINLNSLSKVWVPWRKLK